MNGLKRAGIFLLIFITLTAGAVLAAWGPVTECVSVIFTGAGRDEYALVGTDTEGGIYALAVNDGRYTVVRGDSGGTRRSKLTVPPEFMPEESIPAAFYPAPDGVIYLGVYDTGESPVQLKLYRISRNGGLVELLLSEPGTGSSLREQMASVRLSDFTSTVNSVDFAVLSGDEATFYRRGDESGLVETGTFSQPGLRGAMALSDEVWVLVTDEGLVRTDRDTLELAENEMITQLDQAGIGVYYVDGASLKVYYADFADWHPYSYMSLEKSRYDMDHCTDLRVSRGGDVVILLDGQRLVIDRGSSVTDVSSMLHRPTAVCVLILAAIVLAALVASFFLWYLVCVQRRSRLPLLLRWGVLLTAVAVLAVIALARISGPRAVSGAAAREAHSMMSSAALLSAKGTAPDDLPGRVASGLGDTGTGLFRDVRAGSFVLDGELWRLAASNTGARTGIRAELFPGFDGDMAQEALDKGSSFRTVRTGDGCRYYYCLKVGDRLLTLDVDAAGMLEETRDDSRWMTWQLAGLAAALTALAVLALLGVTGGLHRLMGAMEALIRGERDVSAGISSGDELESLGDDLTNLSRAIGEREDSHRALESSYRRFVPEKVLSLLGKQSIAEVDKMTFVARNLATMSFSFRFPEQTYEHSGRELFENVNEIIERTASIVNGRGGAVFNFGYDSYDAVFEEGSAAAVSAAVAIQQEILEINRQREADERPSVTARIVLDEGPIILGVVGDENQIEPTSVSASFSQSRRLMELCGRLDATILCTESVISKAEGYSSRYIGKCAAGAAMLRTYEIFDGDPYDSRKFKEQNLERFADGVYAFYSRDYSKSKSVFLSLVRRSTADGCARYYLYLADRMEKETQAEPSLDLGL